MPRSTSWRRLLRLVFRTAAALLLRIATRGLRARALVLRPRVLLAELVGEDANLLGVVTDRIGEAAHLVARFGNVVTFRTNALHFFDRRADDLQLGDLAATAPGAKFPYQGKVVNASDINAFA